MELQDLQDELDELRPDDEEASESIRLLMAKLGQMAEANIRIEDIPEDKRGEVHRDLVAGIILTCAEYATEYDVDIGHAIEERLDKMRERREKYEEVQKAMKEGDAEALAEALDADANEVPTGAFGDGEDDDRRGFH
jgi:hypothetical protein